MNEFMILLGCGFAGGMIRGLIGLMKNKLNSVSFSASYFVFTILASGIIGAFASSILFSDYKIALLAGYAGTDILENALKLIKARILTQETNKGVESV